MDYKNKEALAALILRKVSMSSGYKRHDLIIKIRQEYDVHIHESDLNSVLEELIAQNKLIEVEFTLNMTDVGGFLLPAGARLNIRGYKEEIHRI